MSTGRSCSKSEAIRSPLRCTASVGRDYVSLVYALNTISAEASVHRAYITFVITMGYGFSVLPVRGIRQALLASLTPRASSSGFHDGYSNLKLCTR